MENSNSSSKNEQPVNEGFSGENIATPPNDSPELKTEFETDNHGNTVKVERARYYHTERDIAKAGPLVDYPTKSIDQTPENAEHKDLNSNPNPKQFPNAIKQNQENRGNIVD